MNIMSGGIDEDNCWSDDRSISAEAFKGMWKNLPLCNLLIGLSKHKKIEFHRSMEDIHRGILNNEILFRSRFIILEKE